jgi:hypothetical protein
MNGQFYMNIHTAVNPGGEMRGNLVAVPQLGSLGFLLAPPALAILRRRRPSRVP